MNKAQLISALEWFKDDTEIFIRAYHPVLTGIYELYRISEVQYNLPPYEQAFIRAHLTDTSGGSHGGS